MMEKAISSKQVFRFILFLYGCWLAFLASLVMLRHLGY